MAVLTYRRPGDLSQLLPVLDGQAGRVAGSSVQILVVDNDADRSGEKAWQDAGLADSRYVVEATPGIAAARNRALAEAGGRDVLIFVDDDERPCSSWLSLLLSAYDSHDAPGVVGPVVSEYSAALEPWVEAGRFFDRRRMPTGSPVTVAATNNLLLDLAAVRKAGIRFDERFGLAGGSDTLFTRQFVRAAGPMAWCDEAVVTDVVPAERCTRDWVLRRALRSGNSWSRTAIALDDSALLRVRLASSGLVRAAGGAARYVLGLVTRNLAHQAKGARTLARGAGMAGGALGWTYVEYKRK